MQNGIKAEWLSQVKFFSPSIITIVILLIITYGPLLFNLVLTGDDWEVIVHPQTWTEIQNGRWGQLIVWWLFADNEFSPNFSLAAMLFLFLISAYSIVINFNIKNNIMATLFVGLFVFFPFWSEMVVFKNNHLGAGFGILFATLQGILLKQALLDQWQSKSNKKILLLCLAIFFGVLASSMYQQYYNFGIMLFILFTWNKIFLENDFRQQLTPKGFFWMYGQAFFFVILTGIIYLMLTFALQHYLNMSFTAREGHSIVGGTVHSLGELKEAMKIGGIKIIQFYFYSQSYLPLTAKIIFLFFIGIFIWLILAASTHSRSLTILLLLLGILLLLFPYLLGMSRVGETAFRYTALSPGASLVYAGIIILTVQYIKLPKVKNIMLILAAGMVAIFIFQQGVANVNITASNRRDFYIGGKILAGLEAQPEYSNLLKLPEVELVFIGKMSMYQGRPFFPDNFSTTLQNTTSNFRGIFDSPRRMVNLFRLISGYDVGNFQVKSLEQLSTNQRESVQNFAANMPNWPAANSIKITKNIIVIKFSDSE